MAYSETQDLISSARLWHKKAARSGSPSGPEDVLKGKTARQVWVPISPDVEICPIQSRVEPPKLVKRSEGTYELIHVINLLFHTYLAPKCTVYFFSQLLVDGRRAGVTQLVRLPCGDNSAPDKATEKDH